MRRGISIALLGSLVCVAGISKDARATVTFSLVWVASSGAGVLGSNTIDATTGDVLTLAIRMTNDQPLAGHAVSIAFDTDLGDELNLFRPHGGTEWEGIQILFRFSYTPLVFGLGPPPAIESTGSVAGRIDTFESSKAPSTPPLPAGTYTIGTARFTATGVPSGYDGPDVFIGLFNTGVDRVLDDLNQPLPASSLVFNTATVNYVPEPGSAALVVLGLLAVSLTARHRRGK